MDDSGRLGLRHWASFDPSQLKDCLRDHPAVKLMDVAAERDAAFAERDTAVAEKKTAYAERDAALLQRDVAYADRNSAWMERDTALATLAVVRSGKGNDHAAAKFMQMVNMAVSVPTVDRYMQAVPKPTANDLDILLGYNKQPDRQAKPAGMKAQKSSCKKRKSSGSTSQDMKGSKMPSKKKRKPKNSEGTVIKVRKSEHEEGALLPFDPVVAPIPYCSCTGSSQQCYRWGKGGWQSACCTKSLSMYPLPMNPAKRSCRVPGRKMSGSAFKKLLERLTMDAIDIAAPVDLKNHWAKHGTNRYVTIK